MKITGLGGQEEEPKVSSLNPSVSTWCRSIIYLYKRYFAAGTSGLARKLGQPPFQISHDALP